MDENQQATRRSATRKFMSSLDALEAVLQSTEAEQAAENSGAAQVQAPQPLDFADNPDLEALLDDAVQDIDRFMSGQSAE